MYASNYESILLFLSILTFILQIYVVWLVKHKSPSSMAEYKLFLIMFAFWDLLFTLILGFFLQAVPITPLLAAKVHGLAYYFNDFWCRITVSGAIYAGANVIMSQDFCLTYRFTVLQENKIFHRVFMSKAFKICNFIFAQALSLGLGWAFYQTLLPDDVAKKIILSMDEPIRLQVNQTTDLLLYIEFEFPFTKHLFLTIVGLFFVSEVYCIALIVMILSILRANASLFSKNTYKLHLQFTILLAVQLITPVIFIVAPITVCIVAVFMAKPSTELTTEIGLTMLTLYGMTNSLFTILFVSPYRIHGFNTFIYPWLRPLMLGLKLGKHLPANGRPIPSMTFSHNIQVTPVRKKNVVFSTGFFNSNSK